MLPLTTTSHDTYIRTCTLAPSETDHHGPDEASTPATTPAIVDRRRMATALTSIAGCRTCMHVASRPQTRPYTSLMLLWCLPLCSLPACQSVTPPAHRPAAAASSSHETNVKHHRPTRGPTVVNRAGFQASKRALPHEGGRRWAGDRRLHSPQGSSTSDCPLLIDQCINATLVS